MNEYSEGYVKGWADGQANELADIIVYLEANYDCEDILSDLRLRRDAVEAWA
jgi:hypothetical protein